MGGGGVGVGDCADATEMTIQFRPTRNASLLSQGAIFTKLILNKDGHTNARTFLGFLAEVPAHK